MLCSGFITFLVICIFPGKTDTEPESRQMEFEDVWLASQVEPLQDNFDVLGRFLFRMNKTKEIVFPSRYVTLKMDI